jgi:RNA polymerase sigma-70 factor (ECF subfamily)
MWRLLRRLGVPAADLDDAVQEVVVVLARKLSQIQPSSERAFVLSTAYRVASTVRRTQRRRPPHEELEDEVSADPTESPEELLERRRARTLLDGVLAELPIELRAVFVLYELERLTSSEIAAALELAPGTVASRLRRARALFEERVQALELRMKETSS